MYEWRLLIDIVASEDGTTINDYIEKEKASRLLFQTYSYIYPLFSQRTMHDCDCREGQYIAYYETSQLFWTKWEGVLNWSEKSIDVDHFNRPFILIMVLFRLLNDTKP